MQQFQMVQIAEESLEDYNQINTAQMKLVLFMDALTHMCRISRVIRQPLGNALLLGMGGSGRQSMTRLAAHMWVCLGYGVFILTETGTYAETETDKMGVVPNVIGSEICLNLDAVWTPAHSSIQAIFIGLGLCQCELIVV